MWENVQHFFEHINKYSNVFGQVWFWLWIVFRLIVVASIGGQVYEDEREQFKCSTQVIGCENVCYDRFAKISHLRFWSFELVIVAFPVILFYVYTLKIENRVQKIKYWKKRKRKQSKLESKDYVADDIKEKGRSKVSKFDSNIENIRKKLGKSKVKKRILKKSDDELNAESIHYTKNLLRFYLFQIFFRTAIEALFIYLTVLLVSQANYDTDTGEIQSGSSSVLFVQVPLLYACTGETVKSACYQHMLPKRSESYVPCWVSRPWEKTYFLLYMNVLSILSVLLGVGEFVLALCKMNNNSSSESKADSVTKPTSEMKSLLEQKPDPNLSEEISETHDHNDTMSNGFADKNGLNERSNALIKIALAPKSSTLPKNYSFLSNASNKLTSDYEKPIQSSNKYKRIDLHIV